SAAIFSMFPAPFGNQSVDDSAVLIHYAIAGDAAVNGGVNALDFNVVATNYGASGQSWINGDFNYDGVVDSADFTMLASNFNVSLPAAAVPRPAAPAAAPSLFSNQSVRTADSVLDEQP